MSPLAAEDIQQLVPAFVGAAAVILVVAAGVLIFVWRQYPPSGSEAASGDDPERVAVKRGLKVSGLVFAALGLAGFAAAIAFRAATIFGPAVLLVPAAVIIDGLMFVIAAGGFSTASTR